MNKHALYTGLFLYVLFFAVGVLNSMHKNKPYNNFIAFCIWLLALMLLVYANHKKR
nr:hypothetical protein [uncultured Flavobacterium sp.]